MLQVFRGVFMTSVTLNMNKELFYFKSTLAPYSHKAGRRAVNLHIISEYEHAESVGISKAV